MDDRLAFFFAAQEIERRLGFSPGAAQARLRELCASGVVRSWKEPYSIVGGQPEGEGPPELIEPSEWRVREVDLASDADGCMNFVNVSKIDFDHWLNGHQASKSGGRSTPKRAWAKLAISKLWPDGIKKPVSNAQIENEVLDWLKGYWKRENRRSVEISRDTILRAAGRK
jgi:hypothetical protein